MDIFDCVRDCSITLHLLIILKFIMSYILIIDANLSGLEEIIQKKCKEKIV